MVKRTLLFCGSLGPCIKEKGETVVKRWHVLPVQQNETVAAHTFDVMVNAWAIARLLQLHGYKAKIDIQVLMEEVMVHDIEEIITGDIPHTFKKGLKPKMRKMLTEQAKKSAFKIIKGRFPSVLSGLMFKRWSDCQEGKTLESQIIKVSDFLAALNFLENEVMGLSNHRVKEELCINAGELIKMRKRYPWFVDIWDLIFGQTPEELIKRVKQFRVSES